VALKLGVLDQSPIRDGGTAAEAIAETLQLAKATERLGYTRYWLAEHHNSKGLASSSPEVLIARVAAETSTMRIGSGGVMLSHYSALKVAENFRTLETLYPGRVDLGMGRAPGTDGRTAVALSAGPGAVGIEAYPEQVADLLRFVADALPEGHYFSGIQAQPQGPTVPEPWLLGSSLESASLAGELGVPFSFAHFINESWAGEAITLYRRIFRPSRWLDEPHVTVGVSAICADADERAEELAMSRWLWRLRNRQGRRYGVPSVADALAEDLSDAEREYIRFEQANSLVGGPERVRDRLNALAAELEVDEFIVVTITYDFADRVRSYELLAEAFDLAPPSEAG
jgi:luciferase family oxidoreductase group 1